jgi:anti-sigma factor RsiW
VKSLDRHHPSDERLVALYFEDGSLGTEDDRQLRQHLHGCEACTWRYTELTAPLQQLRRDAASEADEVFTPGRLAAQRGAIRSRLEGSADRKVITFPGTSPARVPLIRRPAARWMAAAAAAGLFIGVSAGRLMHSPTQPAALTARVEAPATPLVASASPETTATDAGGIYSFAREEMFLLEVDSAVTSPRVDELYALDELTPHPREMMVAMVR